MSFIQVFLIGIGLSMDSASISALYGIESKKNALLEALRISFFFGLFHTIMPIVGWLLGVGLESIIKGVDHWIAFILLSIIGIRLIYNSLNKRTKKININNYSSLIFLAIATSIDALIIGISLGLINSSLFILALTIGMVNFLMCLIFYFLGERLKKLIGKKAEMFGGIILILIGLKTLIDHLRYW